MIDLKNDRSVLDSGQAKQVTACILSHHKPGEEIIKVEGWTPPIPGTPPAQ